MGKPPTLLYKVVCTILTPHPPEAMPAKRKRCPADGWIPRHFNLIPTDPSIGINQPLIITESSIVTHSSAVAHSSSGAHSLAVNQTFVKHAVKPKPVPSQLPVYLPPPPPIYEGQENHFRTKIIVSHLNSSGDFYVRINENEKIYDNMTRQLDLLFAKLSQLEQLYEQLNPAEVKTVGLVCATKDDGHWNRCLIVDIIVDDKTVTVSLMDVGRIIKASCTQLFRMNSSTLPVS
jgi:hypothetical protein